MRRLDVSERRAHVHPAGRPCSRISSTALSGSSRPRLHLVEQPLKLGVAGDGLLEVRLRPRARDREDLAGELVGAPFRQEPLVLEVRAMLLDRLPQLVDPAAADRLGEDDRRLPVALGLDLEDRAHLGHHRPGRRMVALVHDDHVGNLHDPGLERLDRVARARHEREHGRVGEPGDLDLALAGPDRLDVDEVLAGGVEDQRGLERRLGEPAQVPAGPHRADEDLGIEEVVGEPDPVAEQRARGERAGRVDRDDADRLASSPRARRTSAARSVDFPTPGGPVMPTTYALPVSP